MSRQNLKEPTFEDILEEEHPWTTKDIGVNAISGLLNESTQEFSFLTKKQDNIVAAPPTQFRRIRNTEFEAYVKSLTDVIDKYQLNKALGTGAMEGIPQLGPSADDLDNEIQHLDESVARHLLQQPQQKGITKVERARMISANASSKDTIPTIFSEKDFDLKNPHIFSAVTEYKDVVGVSATDALAVSKQLQDQLSHLLDTVEVHLLKEISRRSSSFFEALSHLKALHGEIQTCVDQIDGLKAGLKAVSDTTAKKALAVVQLKRRRGNVAMLSMAVKMANDLKNTPPVIQELLSQADYVGALDMLDEASGWLRGETKNDKHDQVEVITNGITLTKMATLPRSFSLASLPALQSIRSQLSYLEEELESVMKHEFVMLLNKDLREQVDRMIQQSTEYAFNRNSTVSKPSAAMNWARNILNEKYSSSPVSGTPQVANTTVSLLEQENFLRTQLSPLVRGLLRMDRLGLALEEYRNSLNREIKAMTNKIYPVSTAIKADPDLTTQQRQELKASNQAELARKLRAMNFEEFYQLLQKLYVTLLNLIQRGATIHELISEISKSCQSTNLKIGIKCLPREAAPSEPSQPPKRQRAGTRSLLRRGMTEEFEDLGSFDDLQVMTPGKSATNIFAAELAEKSFQKPSTDTSEGPSTFQQNMSDSSDVLFNACELAHIRCAKLLTVRSEQNVKLTAQYFYKLFGATWEFLAATESLCGRMCFPLKGCILSQAKHHLNNFHDDKCKHVAALIENEQWVPADIPVDFQHITNDLQLSVSRAKSVDEMEDSPAPSDREDDSEVDLTSLAGASKPEQQSVQQDQRVMKQLVIDGSKYYVVGTVLLFLKSLTEYVKCAENLQSLGPEILNRVYEILKLFNSRVCQVILGAGAMQSAGLKNISARHIALACQSLAAVMAAIPYLKSGLSQFIPQKQQVLLNDFDKIIGDYRDHQNELYLKLVSIMNERLGVQANAILAINWDTPDLNKDFVDGVSVPMGTLVKETTTLHKVLNKYLPPEALKSVLTEIFRSYNKRFEEDLKKIDLFSSAAKNRLLIDVQHLISQLSALVGVDGPGNHLEVCVNNIKIKDKRTYVPANSVKNVPPAPAAPVPKAGNTSPVKSNFGYNFGNMLRNQTTDKNNQS
ncbi:Vps54-like protein-domain-containing protein [Gorgonomyces haynaldii]|nr:Vps54-like protein-domain-containing protein [Gorgonomyces haynaldii]